MLGAMRTVVPLPGLEIRGRNLPLAVVQGGMGVGLSRSRLAGTVAGCGGMGTLAAQGLGAVSTLEGAQALVRGRRRDDPHGVEVLAYETRAARELAGDRGLVAVNVMVAVTHYADLVRSAVAGGAQAIVSGAGVPLDLPALVPEPHVALIPIVSSPRALMLICRHWAHFHGGRRPDAVVVEGPLAGGHLGFKREDLDAPENAWPNLLPRILEEARKWGEFPVIAAGGIFDHDDAQQMLSLGAAGVQLGTRFVTTDECDVDDRYKAVYLRCTPEQIMLLKTPVGLWARALRTPLLERFERGDYPGFKCHYQCLSTCLAHEVRYCIADHLIDAAKGDEQGFFFAGSNAWRCREILPVAELMRRLRDGEPSQPAEATPGTAPADSTRAGRESPSQRPRSG